MAQRNRTVPFRETIVMLFVIWSPPRFDPRNIHTLESRFVLIILEKQDINPLVESAFDDSPNELHGLR